MDEPLAPTTPRRIVSLRTVVGVLLVVGVTVGLFFLPDTQSLWQMARDRLTAWQDIAAENLPVALLVFAAVYVPVVTLPIPLAAVFALIGGAVFGPWVGFAVLSAGSVVAAVLAFLAARYLCREWVRRNFGHRLKRLNEGVAESGGVYLVALRWVPMVPFFVINAAMGLTPIRTGKYALVSGLAMAPLTLMYAFAGSRLRELHSPRDAVRAEVLIAFGLLAVVPVGLKHLARRVLRRRNGVAVAVR